MKITHHKAYGFYLIFIPLDQQSNAMGHWDSGLLARPGAIRH
jgi:hypothetical protein